MEKIDGETVLSNDEAKRFEKAVHECYYRHKTPYEVDICQIECIPCSRAIEIGRCDVLRELFKDEQETEEKAT